MNNNTAEIVSAIKDAFEEHICATSYGAGESTYICIEGKEEFFAQVRTMMESQFNNNSK